jgi:DNA replication and repair protein RecF
MHIKSVELSNFRSHANRTIKFGENLNILWGENAAGKTNILEAIYYTCLGKGFKSPRDRDAIKFGEKFAQIKTTVRRNYGDLTVEITLNGAPNAKFIKINATPIARIGELLGNITCVFFNPDELKLVREAPEDRRRFLDIAISQLDKTYFYTLLKYNKILKQRNAMLKDFKSTETENRALDIWDEQLSNCAMEIIKKRVQFCEQLTPIVKQIHKDFTDIENIDIAIETINAETFLKVLKAARLKDLKLKTTTVGPHRDDLSININGKDVRQFASQGQQRTAALSLKIATLKIFETATGEKPILLLDDVFSELDKTRRDKLLTLVGGYQTIITTADKPLTNDANWCIIRICG